MADDLSHRNHTVFRHNQLGAVSGEEERLQRDYFTTKCMGMAVIFTK